MSFYFFILPILSLSEDNSIPLLIKAMCRRAEGPQGHIEEWKICFFSMDVSTACIAVSVCARVCCNLSFWQRVDS